MSKISSPPHELAQRLAAKLIHDIVAPISGLQGGLDLLSETAELAMREEAVSLIRYSVGRLTGLLDFHRAAFGAGDQTLGGGEIERLCQGRFAEHRADLDWRVTTTSLPAAPARALLILVEIAAGALPFGGVAAVTFISRDDRDVVRVEARHSRARLAAETLAGLTGEALGEGLAGRWVQGAYLYTLVSSASGSLRIDEAAGVIAFEATFPS